MRKLPIQWIIVFVIIAVIFFFGCKDKGNSVTIDSLENNSSINIQQSNGETAVDTFVVVDGQHRDTVIRQEVWYNDGKYYLQTYLLTDPNQIHPRSGRAFGIGGETEFAPYANEISGTFEFIKAVKKDELNKALLFFAEKKERDSIIKANLNELNSIQ